MVPLVSAKTAWNQGAYGWSNTQRRSFLQWYQQAPRECAVGSGGRSGSACGYVLQSNARLTAQITDLTTQPRWKPTCGEIAAVSSILASWGMSVEPRAARAMEAKVSSCSGGVTVRPLNRTNPVPATEVGNPFLAPGTAARQWSTTQVLDAPAGPAIPASFFGLHIPDLTGPTPPLPYEWLRLWDAKTGWEPLEQNRGTYYWKWIDDAVAYAEANGKKVMYVFGDTPGWAGPSPAYPPVDIAEYSRYVNAVVARYGNRIDAYEVWNEPNLFVPISESLADLVDMTEVVHSAVKGRGLSSLVLTPSTTMRTGTAVYPFFSEYLVPLAKRGWPVDGFTFHTYPRAAGGPQQRAQAIALFKEMLALAKAPALPIWDTEINYGLGGLDEPQRDITGADAQGYLSAVVHRRRPVRGHPGRLVPVVPDLLQAPRHPDEPRHDGDERGVAVDARAARRVLASGVQYRSGPAVVCGFSRGGSSFALAYSLRWLGRVGEGAGPAGHPVRHRRPVHPDHRRHGDRRHPAHQADLIRS